MEAPIPSPRLDSFVSPEISEPDGFEPDAVVIGAGFGGLGAALALAERGARVVVCETLKYPGGCASTFEHKGRRFEAGATLFSGFGEGQLFRRWIDRYDLDVEIDWLDPVVELRTPGWNLEVPPDRERFVERMLRLPGAPAIPLRRFFDHQRRVAEALWPLLDDPSLLPPFGLRDLLRHAGRVPEYLPLLRDVGRPLASVVERFGLGDWRPLRTYLDALCQITVQCSADEAEAPFALSTLDYYFRGTGHVRGGIGALAWALVGAIERLGGQVRFTDRVKRLERDASGWIVHTRRGTLRAPRAVANLLPQNVADLLGGDDSIPRARRRLGARASDVAKGGWGACMLYRTARAPEGFGASAHHLEIVQDPASPLVEGNHLFASIGAANDDPGAADGYRALTVSTHVPMDHLLALSEKERGEYVASIQERMRHGLARFAPEWCEDVDFEATASPRTFERFTGRRHGFVGGVPRRAGLGQYLDLVPAPVLPGLHLVGDSVFPGQSTLATALGGVKLAGRLG